MDAYEEDTGKYFAKAGKTAKALSLDASLTEALSHPRVVLKFTFPFGNDDGAIGSGIDVSAPREIRWLTDTYQMLNRHDVDGSGITTNKIREVKGIDARVEATAQGVYYGVQHIMDRIHEYSNELSLALDNNSTAGVQGFDNTGYHATLFFSEDANVTGVDEYDDHLKGLDIEPLKEYDSPSSTLPRFSGGTTHDIDEPDKVLELECDVLIPAAREQNRVWKNYISKLIDDVANGPLSCEADYLYTKVLYY